MIDLVRLILSIALIIGVYTETGVFTALFAGLVMIAFEMHAREINGFMWRKGL